MESTLDGKAILKESKTSNGLLHFSSRRKLSRLIVRTALEKHPKQTITSYEFTKWANEIALIFPKESAVVYYSPYQGSTTKGAKKNASGKLYEAYIARRRTLRKSGILPAKQNTSKNQETKNTLPLPIATASSEENDTDQLVSLQDKLQVLRSLLEPIEQVTKYWQATATARLTALLEGGLVSDYFKLYPALKLGHGYNLVSNLNSC